MATVVPGAAFGAPAAVSAAVALEAMPSDIASRARATQRQTVGKTARDVALWNLSPGIGRSSVTLPLLSTRGARGHVFGKAEVARTAESVDRAVVMAERERTPQLQPPVAVVGMAAHLLAQVGERGGHVPGAPV